MLITAWPSPLELFYEELLLADRATRWQQVESLWSHLGVSPCTDRRVGRFFENALFLTGGPATYGRLPNVAEIEATLGSDETGHIGYAPRIEGLAVDVRRAFPGGARAPRRHRSFALAFPQRRTCPVALIISVDILHRPASNDRPTVSLSRIV
jgi:hypothetical protein